MNINDFISELRSYISSINRYSLFAQNYKAETTTSTEILFGENELREFFNKCIEYLIKGYTEESLEEYPYADCKDTIEYRNVQHETIATKVQWLQDSMTNSNVPYNATQPTKFNSYIIRTESPTEDIAFFITAKNPIKCYSNSKFYINQHPTVRSERYNRVRDMQLIQLLYHFDAIIFHNNFYFITTKMESHLGLPKDYKDNKDEAITELQNILPESDYQQYMQPYIQRKNAKSFKNYNRERMANLEDPDKREKIAQGLHIPLKNNGNFDLSQEGANDKLISYLTNKIGSDIDDPNQNVISSTILKNI